MNACYMDLLRETRGTIQTVHNTKQLWREGYKSRLIKVGMALVMIPEPTPVTPTLGACFIAVGAAQKAIRNRSLFMEDVNKIFQTTMKDIAATKQNI